MTIALPDPVHRFTRREYYRMGESGLFDGRRVQLIDGQIIDMAPQNYRHGDTIELLDGEVRKMFGRGFRVRVQLPLVVSDYSEPEPDVAIVAGPRGAGKDHPKSAVLVIEVADTTLRLDRRKAAKYASIGVPEYWIVNLVDDFVEVYRNPVREAGEWRYDEVRVVTKRETISPLAKPRVKVRVSRLLA